MDVLGQPGLQSELWSCPALEASDPIVQYQPDGIAAAATFLIHHCSIRYSLVLESISPTPFQPESTYRHWKQNRLVAGVFQTHEGNLTFAKKVSIHVWRGCKVFRCVTLSYLKTHNEILQSPKKLSRWLATSSPKLFYKDFFFLRKMQKWRECILFL